SLRAWYSSRPAGRAAGGTHTAVVPKLYLASTIAELPSWHGMLLTTFRRATQFGCHAAHYRLHKDSASYCQRRAFILPFKFRHDVLSHPHLFILEQAAYSARTRQCHWRG
ncbi:unnamed protein product, partial [Laminaria digitata]